MVAPTAFTTSGTSRSDGSASGQLANVPPGLYDVTRYVPVKFAVDGGTDKNLGI